MVCENSSGEIGRAAAAPGAAGPRASESQEVVQQPAGAEAALEVGEVGELMAQSGGLEELADAVDVMMLHENELWVDSVETPEATAPRPAGGQGAGASSAGSE